MQSWGTWRWSDWQTISPWWKTEHTGDVQVMHLLPCHVPGGDETNRGATTGHIACEFLWIAHCKIYMQIWTEDTLWMCSVGIFWILWRTLQQKESIALNAPVPLQLFLWIIDCRVEEVCLFQTVCPDQNESWGKSEVWLNEGRAHLQCAQMWNILSDWPSPRLRDVVVFRSESSTICEPTVGKHTG